MQKLHAGIGDKVAVFLQWTTNFVAAYVVAFLHGWKLTLTALAFSPLFAVLAGVIAKASIHDLPYWGCRCAHVSKLDAQKFRGKQMSAIPLGM